MFLIADIAASKSVVIVTVFTPPAVPTGEPPINIRISDKSADGVERFSWGIVANPAVLVVMDWKKEACIFSSKESSFIVEGLLYSKIKNKIAPVIIRIAVELIAILE